MALDFTAARRPVDASSISGRWWPRIAALPLGTVVRVTNLENSRTVTLRVIDRRAMRRNVRKGAIIDVSKGAARRLRFIRDGLVFMRVEVVPPADRGNGGDWPRWRLQ